MIQIKNCTAVASGRRLFTNFTFTIGRDEHWLLQGENGSGKTALLELIAGNLNVVSGEIVYSFISSKDWEQRHQEIRQSIRYIPAHSLHTLLTGHHELFYQQRYYSMGDERFPCVRDLLTGDVGQPNLDKYPVSFRIDELLDLELIRLSNGQLKKVLILQQLLKGIPKFLLLDYPFEGLDEDSREELIVFLDEIVVAFKIQLIIVDHHHHLPAAMNRKLILHHLEVSSISEFNCNNISGRVDDVIESTDITHSRDTIVEMKDVTIAYGSRIIIDKLNWKIHRGDRWSLTGKNGSGKTTLFSLIFADHPLAYAQQIFLFGRRRGTGESIWDIKNRIAYLGPEQLHFLDPSAYAIPARQFILRTRDVNPEMLDQLVSFFAASHLMETPLRFLSSGQLQLVLLIQSLTKDKELILFDEPFQFLDPVIKQKASAFLNERLNSHTTLIMITHYDDDTVKWALRKSI